MWFFILNIYIFYMHEINFVHCLFITRLWQNFLHLPCLFILFVVIYSNAKSDINNNETDYSFSANQYLMKSSLIVLNILFSINCVRLFSILFALSGSIKHFAWNDITGKFYVLESLGKFLEFHLDFVYNHFFNFSNLKF